jgi:hypothetical protein
VHVRRAVEEALPGGREVGSVAATADRRRGELDADRRLAVIIR